MKKLFLLILILASNLFGQGWNNIVTTTINEPNYHTDIFTNSSGIHILIRNFDNNIVYYNLNSAGSVEKTCTLETSESGSFPNIVGSNDKIYAIYKTGNNIRVKYSTDNGSNWLTDIADRPTTANDCNGVDAVYELNYGIHIVWATRDDTTPAFETYYYRLNTFDQWVDPKTVTDHNAAQTGGNPSVTVSQSRVHVSFNTDATTTLTGSGDVKTRDKYTGNWQTPQTVVYNSEKSLDERLLVRGDYLYLFYNCSNSNDLKYKTRPVASTSWLDYPPIESGLVYYYEDAFEITKTINDYNYYIHIVYKMHISGQGWSYTYKYFDGTNWIAPDPHTLDYNSVGLRQIGLSSVSDDLFCTWVKSGTPYLRYRQWDDIPIAPTGLTITEDANHHPRLNWNANPEPDIHHYIIERYDTYGGGWQYLNQTPNCTTYTYTDETLTYCHAVPPAQCPDVRTFYFRVKAVDSKPLTPLTSPASNQVEARLRGGPPSKIVADHGSNESIEYSLSQNYPNPFNPTTSIDYSIKSAGDVSLKVYDILGTEVASLVNENQDPGNYSVKFNASELPSGIYFYTLNSGNFISTKKLILLR
jgi:hypothetical protein